MNNLLSDTSSIFSELLICVFPDCIDLRQYSLSFVRQNANGNLLYIYSQSVSVCFKFSDMLDKYTLLHPWRLLHKISRLKKRQTVFAIAISFNSSQKIFMVRDNLSRTCGSAVVGGYCLLRKDC